MPLDSSTSSASSDSSTAPDPVAIESALRAVRVTRTAGFRAAAKAFAKQEQAYGTAVAALRAKQAELRRGCRDALRRANRDDRLEIALRCFRGDLTGEREMVRKQQAYVRAVPGVESSVRSSADRALSSLLDAVTTIVDAVDSGVYRSTDVMLETRRNLRAKYQSPSWDALSRLRAERGLTVVAQLILDAEAAMEEERVILQGEPQPAWNEARGCLAAREAALHAFLQPADATKRPPLGPILTPLSGCLDALAALERAQPTAPDAGSSSSP